MLKQANDKSKILKIFNNNILEFCKFCNKIIPNESDIMTLQTITETFCKYNPKKLIDIWYVYIEKPYSELILKGDFNYFENKNYSHDLRDLNTNVDYVLRSYNAIRIRIAKLEQSNKLKAMNYIQILSKLSRIYFN